MKGAFAVFFFLVASTAFAQPDTLTPPYKRFPALPPLHLLLADSTTRYAKADVPRKRPVLVMLFSPECDHCRHEAQELAARADDTKNVHVIMATTYPLSDMKAFVEACGLNRLSNVVVGRDVHYLLPPFYNVRNYPFFALYNKKGELMETIEGAVGIGKVLEKFGGGK